MIRKLKKPVSDVIMAYNKKVSAKKLLAIAVIIGSASCSSNHGSIGHDGYFQLYGDAKGIEAFSDTINGLVTTGKSAPNVVDSYWKHREFKVVLPSKRGGNNETGN